MCILIDTSCCLQAAPATRAREGAGGALQHAKRLCAGAGKACMTSESVSAALQSSQDVRPAEHSFVLCAAGTACKWACGGREVAAGAASSRYHAVRQQAATWAARVSCSTSSRGSKCAWLAQIKHAPHPLPRSRPPRPAPPCSGDVCNGFTRVGDKTYCRLNGVDVCTCQPPATCGSGANTWCSEVRRGAPGHVARAAGVDVQCNGAHGAACMLWQLQSMQETPPHVQQAAPPSAGGTSNERALLLSQPLCPVMCSPSPALSRAPGIFCSKAIMKSATRARPRAWPPVIWTLSAWWPPGTLKGPLASIPPMSGASKVTIFYWGSHTVETLRMRSKCGNAR